MKTLIPFIHYGLHFLAPIFIARIWFRDRWKQVSLVLIGTMLVDLDHLLSDPIFDPDRLSLGNHLLHSYYAIGIYFILCFFQKTRVVAFGLLFHMFTDSLDYLMRQWVS